MSSENTTVTTESPKRLTERMEAYYNTINSWITNLLESNPVSASANDEKQAADIEQQVEKETNQNGDET